MSTQAEKIKAQEMALNDRPSKPWHRHLIGPVELKRLLDAAEATPVKCAHPVTDKPGPECSSAALPAQARCPACKGWGRLMEHVVYEEDKCLECKGTGRAGNGPVSNGGTASHE